MVYVAICDCPLLYVGKTIRELRRRVLEHIGHIEHSRDTPVAKHMRRVHQTYPFSLKFWVLEVIKINERKGDRGRLLLQKEATWIYRLGTVHPRGLNDLLSFVPFI